MPACECGWEALRGDPLPWLLDEHRPNLHWRVLTELVGRPPQSPAVQRARGGASAVEPVASLLADLHPDGQWATHASWWRRYTGPGWRLISAMSYGADPTDPRLHATCDLFLETTPGEGGFSPRRGDAPAALVTARMLQALAGLRYCSHLRFQEALAWVEEDPAAWPSAPRELRVVASAVLSALTACPENRREELRARVVDSLLTDMDRVDGMPLRPGHPNLIRTDPAENLWALAMAGVPYDERMAGPLRRLQRCQLEGGRWPRRHPMPQSLPVSSGAGSRSGEPSRWITLHATVAMHAYAVDADLPRMFPYPPPAQ